MGLFSFVHNLFRGKKKKTNNAPKKVVAKEVNKVKRSRWTDAELQILSDFVVGCRTAGMKPDYKVASMWLKGRHNTRACRVAASRHKF